MANDALLRILCLHKKGRYENKKTTHRATLSDVSKLRRNPLRNHFANLPHDTNNRLPRLRLAARGSQECFNGTPPTQRLHTSNRLVLTVKNTKKTAMMNPLEDPLYRTLLNLTGNHLGQILRVCPEFLKEDNDEFKEVMVTMEKTCTKIFSLYKKTTEKGNLK